jgi:hypothetical protein
MREFTDKEIQRQDFVDNEIFDLLQRLAPKSVQIEWDIETIGDIRNVLRGNLVNRYGVLEQEFYPYKVI